MTRYINSNPHGALQSVEILPMAHGNVAHLHLHGAVELEAVRRQITAPELGQEILAQTQVDGRPMLVTRGARSEGDLVKLLEMGGGKLQPHAEKKPFDAWKIRSLLGFAGQTLQLASSLLRTPTPEKKGLGILARADRPVFIFAASNLAANTINLVYRAQNVEDPHRLRVLKQQVNDRLSPHLAPGTAAPGVDENRSAMRDGGKKKVVQGLNGFMERNSVRVGELGLRYIGAFGLAFRSESLFGKQGPKLELNESGLRQYAGLSSIAGKTVALASTIPDPYNPKPRGLLDRLREKSTFLAGGLIEITSFSALAYDCFFRTTGEHANRGIQFTANGKSHRDWLGGVGASLFVLGYVVRCFAKYGERNVNMDELYAHTSDALAKLPAEKIPQALADSAAHLAEHFKDKSGLGFATIYDRLAADLGRHHPIVLQPKALAAEGEPQDREASQPRPQVQAASIAHTQLSPVSSSAQRGQH